GVPALGEGHAVDDALAVVAYAPARAIVRFKAQQLHLLLPPWWVMGRPADAGHRQTPESGAGAPAAPPGGTPCASIERIRQLLESAFLMNVTIKQLRAFVNVVNAGSFTEAAKRLYVTQSALSLLLRELES